MAKGFSKMNINRSLKVVSETFRQGIGMSKREVYQNNGGTSPYTHSYSTFNRYMGVIKEFANYVREEFGVNRIDKIKEEHMKSYIEHKISKGVREKTLKVNMSALEKYAKAIKRDDLYNHIHKNYQDYYAKAKPSGRAEAFTNPEKVINSLRDPAHRAIAELQYRTGARLGDVKKIKVNEERKQVIIENSKGGRDRVLDYSDRPEKFEKIKEAKQELDKHLESRSWKEIRESYPGELKKSAIINSEKYTGTHSFRVTYARERFKELTGMGYSESQADKIITQELGHNREDMSRYYRNSG